MRKVTDTSLWTPRSMDHENLREIHRRILYALSQMFEGTFEDIASFLQTDKSSIWKRLSELDKAGLIYRPGIKKALRSGRAGKVWRITEKVDQSIPKMQMQVAEKLLAGHSIADFSRKIHAIANSIPAN